MTRDRILEVLGKLTKIVNGEKIEDDPVFKDLNDRTAVGRALDWLAEYVGTALNDDELESAITDLSQAHTASEINDTDDGA